MMSNQVFSSTEELYDETSSDEVLNSYHQESQMRFSENVVYIPHILSPVMLVEYVPVLYNYLTFEPYLMNRFEVVYVPFLRQASMTYLVPYYLQTQEFFSSFTVNEYDTPSNSYPEISLDDVISDALDDTYSSTSLSDVTSVLSLPRSDSSNSYEHTEFNSSTPESCESLQGFVCTEINENFDSKCHDEHNSAQEYLEAYFSESDADDGIETHGSNLSLVFVDDENEPNEYDCTGGYLHPISFHEDRHDESDVSSISLSDYTKKPGGLTDYVKDQVSSMKNAERGRNISPEKSENHVVFDNDTETCVASAPSLEHVDKCLDGYGLENQEPSPLKHEKILHELDCTGKYLIPASFHEDHHIESNVLIPSLLTDAEKTEGLTDSVKIEASSMKNVEKGKNISPETSANDVVFDNDIEICVSNASSLEHVDKCPDDYGLENQEPSPLKRENIPHESDCTGSYLHPISFHENDHVESDVSSPSLLTDTEKPGGLTDSAKIEASSLKNIAKDSSNISPERRENHTIFDSDMESRVSSSLGYAERCQDKNGLENSKLLSVKNKNVNTSDSPSSPQMTIWSQGVLQMKPGSLPIIDAMVPDPFDDGNSEKVNDIDDDPTISVQDILASEEYWRRKREEYFDKRRNTQLYRSALERDIHPRKSLPEVGTLATIFEDLPYPINDPYDDGVELDEESVKDEYFDLPPLEVERSKTTLLPKKKRFRNTRKFFSGLKRCFKPR